ncbi:IS1 family transposase [Candidatus Woesearchaeota archaeon]|nr:IS1 family transposase [Candidatus Woesearchaeota archaeon]
MQNNKIICPVCNSKNIIRAGLKKLKHQTIQRHRCKSCKKYFSDKKLKHKTYNAKIILTAISTYNLHYTLKQTKNIINRKFKIKIPVTTLHSWIKEYKNICTYHRLRKKAQTKFKQNNIISSEKLQHNQIYNFQLHNAKLNLLSNQIPKIKFQLLKQYLKKIQTKQFPHHIFKSDKNTAQSLPRASKIKFNILKFIKTRKQNSANKLANLALLLIKSNSKRHQHVQDFMLTNDSVTIAAEIPIYLTGEDIKYFKNKKFNISLINHKTPITGHIDLVQIRNKLIHILDYKPDAKNQNPVNQLTIYALSLASRTKLAIKDFKCAWFDEKDYYEFYPLHTLYEKRGNKKR